MSWAPVSLFAANMWFRRAWHFNLLTGLSTATIEGILRSNAPGPSIDLLSLTLVVSDYLLLCSESNLAEGSALPQQKQARLSIREALPGPPIGTQQTAAESRRANGPPRRAKKFLTGLSTAQSKESCAQTHLDHPSTFCPWPLWSVTIFCSVVKAILQKEAHCRNKSKLVWASGKHCQGRQ